MNVPGTKKSIGACLSIILYFDFPPISAHCPVNISRLASRRHEMPAQTRAAQTRQSDSTNEGGNEVPGGVRWEKALWRKQPFPDNYVPPSFLAELKALRKF
jgi:hypothetical protein